MIANRKKAPFSPPYIPLLSPKQNKITERDKKKKIVSTWNIEVQVDKSSKSYKGGK